MKIETVQMYKTSDGVVHDTLAKAQQREEVLEIMREWFGLSKNPDGTWTLNYKHKGVG